jgi:plasmid stability protein
MDLNIRDVPAEIMRSLRVDAAAEGISIKELCLRRLVPDGGASWRPQTVTGKPIEEPTKRTSKLAKVSKPETPDPMIKALEFAASGGVEESRSPEVMESAKVIEQTAEKPAARASGCPECGGLNGVHQRGCKRK